jgi:hypothetical protein
MLFELPASASLQLTASRMAGVILEAPTAKNRMSSTPPALNPAKSPNPAEPQPRWDAAPGEEWDEGEPLRCASFLKIRLVVACFSRF